MKKIETIVAYLCSIIFLQSLFFKFTSSAESVWIFKTIGIEPWGRYASGVVELVAAGLLLFPITRLFGAVLAIVTMCGAILAHLLLLGIAVKGDGGLLFILALTCFMCSCFIFYFRKRR